MRKKQALKDTTALHQGPGLGVGGDCSLLPILLGFKVTLEAQSAPEKASGHLAGGTVSAPLPKGPRSGQ